jgi:hypothetical protein
MTVVKSDGPPGHTAMQLGEGSLGLPPASAGFMLGLFFNPEDGDDIFLRNIELSPNCTDLQPRRLHLSQ